MFKVWYGLFSSYNKLSPFSKVVKKNNIKLSEQFQNPFEKSKK